MKLDLDPRLPISNDVQPLKQRLNDLFRQFSISLNSVFAQVKTGELLGNYADDTAAAAGGVAIGQFYRTGSAVKQRVA